MGKSEGGRCVFRRGNRGCGARRQALALPVFDEMQDAGEKAAMRIGPADINDGCIRQFLAEDIKDQAACILVEVIDRFVEHDPVRLMQQKPGEGELVLVIAGQFTFPARDAIEIRRQMSEFIRRRAAIYASFVNCDDGAG